LTLIFWEFAKSLTAIIDKATGVPLPSLFSLFIYFLLRPFLPSFLSSFPVQNYSASKLEQPASLLTRIRKMAGSVLGQDVSLRPTWGAIYEAKADFPTHRDKLTP
jgi:hypothetical protein